MEITYRLAGDYLLPNLKAPKSPEIGKYGLLRERYLRQRKSAIYTGMLLSGRLNAHLEEIDRQANRMLETLTAQMAKAEGVTERLKSEDQLRWVQMMNSVRSRAEETVLAELVYA